MYFMSKCVLVAFMDNSSPDCSLINVVWHEVGKNFNDWFVV